MSREKVTIFSLLGIILLMITIVIFSVPLYNFFCRVTGYGGTTQYSDFTSTKIIDKEIDIRFNADVNDNLNWQFVSPKNIEKIRIGENVKILYKAKNLSLSDNIGTATFNVLPVKAGPYFIKTECFCFQKQFLKSGEEVIMPVVFYVDPSIAEDPTMSDIDTITLSYTFFKYIEK